METSLPVLECLVFADPDSDEVSSDPDSVEVSSDLDLDEVAELSLSPVDAGCRLGLLVDATLVLGVSKDSY